MKGKEADHHGMFTGMPTEMAQGLERIGGSPDRADNMAEDGDRHTYRRLKRNMRPKLMQSPSPNQNRDRNQ